MAKWLSYSSAAQIPSPATASANTYDIGLRGSWCNVIYGRSDGVTPESLITGFYIKYQ